MAWTEKKEKCLNAYAESGSKTEAYRFAYNTKNMSDQVVHNEASKLFLSHDFTVRLEELRAPIRERAGLTLESHLSKLAEIRDLALRENQFGAATTAETNRGKASGLYVEKVETTGKDGGPIKTDTTWTIKVVDPKKD